MATTAYGTNNPLAVKLWSKRLSVEALKACWLYKFIGETTEDLVQIKDETEKSAGALGGAATGAAAGSTFGPYGTAIGAVGGALAGAFG